MTQSTGSALWVWLGGCAAIGATINSALMWTTGAAGEEEISRLSELPETATWVDITSFVLRGLIKADFWLILLLLTLSDLVWLLLPAGAIGSQVFWLLYLRRSARRFHV